MGVSVKIQPGKEVKGSFKGYDVSNSYKLTATARKGISPQLFYDLATVIKMPEKNLADIIHISTRTVSNYKEDKKTLGPVQSEHLLKLIALYEKGEELFGNVDEFSYWLKKPFWGSAERPLDWLVTPGGIDLVMGELVKIAYGDAV